MAGKVGRPKAKENALKRQLSIFLTNDERAMVKHMADQVGVTVSQVIAFLVRQSFSSNSYLEITKDMSQEEQEDLENRRERVQYKTKMRSERAQNRNLSRRMGLDRGLTNVMVVAAPQDFELPGIFCEHYNNVWIIPYCMLHKLEPQRLQNHKCYESVVDYFAGKQIKPLELINFIEQHKTYNLTSEGEKSVLRRLAQVYDSLEGLPVKSCRPEIPERDPALLPYLKDLTVKGEYPYLAFSERQKLLQEALTGALQAIGDVENEIRLDAANVAAETLVPERDEQGNFIKRGRGRPRKTKEAKEATARRRYLRTRAERMLNRVYELALYNNAPVELPPEVSHVEPPVDELSAAFIDTVNELKEYLNHNLALNRSRSVPEFDPEGARRKLDSAKRLEKQLKETEPFAQLERWAAEADLQEAKERLANQAARIAQQIGQGEPSELADAAEVADAADAEAPVVAAAKPAEVLEQADPPSEQPPAQNEGSVPASTLAVSNLADAGSVATVDKGGESSQSPDLSNPETLALLDLWAAEDGADAAPADGVEGATAPTAPTIPTVPAAPAAPSTDHALPKNGATGYDDQSKHEPE